MIICYALVCSSVIHSVSLALFRPLSSSPSRSHQLAPILKAVGCHPEVAVANRLHIGSFGSATEARSSRPGCLCGGSGVGVLSHAV